MSRTRTLSRSNARRLRRQRGVTLVELLITMGLLSGFLIIVSMIFTASVDMQTQTGTYAAVTTDGRFTLSRLDYDIRRADAITTPANPGDASSTLVLTIDNSTHTYAVVDGRLQLDIDSASDYITTDETTLSNLSFQKLGNNEGPLSIRYNFTVTGESGRVPDTQDFVSTTGLRP